MLRDISTVKIQGANFSSLSSFPLFDPRDGKDKDGNILLKTIKGTLLYGKNGTGKSTMAKAFRKAKGEDLPVIQQVFFSDEDGNLVTLSDDEKRQIYVYDEDYVNKNIRLKEDCLDTIIMIGPAADLSDKIEAAESERDDAKTVMETLETTFREYQDANNPKSPTYLLGKIRNALRGDDAWAGRNRRIVGTRQNTPVYDDTYKQFENLSPEKTRSELIVEFEEEMKAYETAKSGSSKIDYMVPSIPNLCEQYNDEAIISLLAEKIEKPNLSKREQYLLGFVNSGKSSTLSQMVSDFSNAQVTHCPYCFQPLSDDYKKELVSSIERVLSKVVSDHQKALQKYVVDDLSIDLSGFECLGNYKICIDLIERINTGIRHYNVLIRNKIDNPYEPIYATSQNIIYLLHQLMDSLAKLESERQEYNKKAMDTSSIIAQLNEINSHIAYYDTVDIVAEYEKQNMDCKAAEDAFCHSKIVYEANAKVVEDLEAQRKNVKMALNVINACLKYIFFAENRLKIDYVDGEYRLYSNGKSVRPCDVSVGERNIIGLSYFFTSIMEGQEEKDVYGKEYLLVIDDPVSSYDTENRIGILSFLKYKLGAFLEGNEFSKAFIMTHDLLTFYDLHKVLEEIMTCCKRKGYVLPPKFNRYEMASGTIKLFCYNNRHEYTEMLKMIYNYGQGILSEHELIIGNMMRQVLEAFATFQYKKGIENVSTDPEILALLPEDKYQSYFNNLMYRLVLHGSSHKEEQIKAMKDYEFFSLISETEKRRTAKEVLCFIYLLNKRHVLQHLQEEKNVEETLDAWCTEIKTRAALP